MVKTNKMTLVFPGQGSQSLGMLSRFNQSDPIIAKTFSEASMILDKDLWALVQTGPAEMLNETINTQPIMLAAGMAVYRAWQSKTPLRPSIIAGHSLGEYTALVISEALNFDDALRLVTIRARLMQETMPVGKGAMAAIIGLSDAQVEAICEEAASNEIVSCANYNSPAQVVIAGMTAAVDRAIELAGIENPFIEALQKAIDENSDENISAVEILEEFSYESEVNLSDLEKKLRNNENLTDATGENGELIIE